MSQALQIWKQNLADLQIEEATCADPAMKIRIKHLIAEAKAKIAELQPEAAPPPPTHDITRIVGYAPEQLIGREAELKLLDDAWTAAVDGDRDRPHVLTLVALGGEGKTSLAAHWALTLERNAWSGCERAFAWSFYSQGTRDQSASSSDPFLKAALTFFGDPATAASPQSAFDKARRLAHLIAEKPSLLILDGLEPLQHSPASVMAGDLKDPAIATLLKTLAARNPGLCLVTTRYPIPDLKAYRRTTAPEHELSRLSLPAGIALLRSFDVHGPASEFETLIAEVKGHALTLTLLGGYLKRAHHGDIRRRDRVKFERADAQTQGGHAFRTIATYERWLLEDGGEEGKREVALLHLVGLFDRPADAGCLKALREAKPTTSKASPPQGEEETPEATTLSPGGRGKGEGVEGGNGREEGEALEGLVKPLRDLVEEEWEYLLTGLESAKLLTANREKSGEMLSLDAHPLLREFFARELREKHPEAWREAHGRLYEYLCESVEHRPDTPEGLQPLYQAISHGCHAGRGDEAFMKVLWDRVQRSGDDYSAKKLGAYGSDLGAAACFFDTPWSRVSPALPAPIQAWLLNEAAFCLRALGRSSEAREPMRAALAMDVEREDWRNAAIIAGNLSELELSLGETQAAVETAKRGVEHADRSGDEFWPMGLRTVLAAALHQAGREDEARDLFQEAERMQGERQPEFPLLYSLQGFYYCDLLLAKAERAAWRRTPNPAFAPSEDLLSSFAEVGERARRTLEWGERHGGLLSIALDRLTLARVFLYRRLLSGQEDAEVDEALERAVDGLRRAGDQNHLPRGLLTRAWHDALTHRHEEAKQDLDEAWEIAERGSMVLHQIDVLLHRARLFYKQPSYPWEGSAQADLKEARRLIEKHGYWRREEELEDAESVIL